MLASICMKKHVQITENTGWLQATYKEQKSGDQRKTYFLNTSLKNLFPIIIDYKVNTLIVSFKIV